MIRNQIDARLISIARLINLPLSPSLPASFFLPLLRHERAAAECRKLPRGGCPVDQDASGPRVQHGERKSSAGAFRSFCSNPAWNARPDAHDGQRRRDATLCVTARTCNAGRPAGRQKAQKLAAARARVLPARESAWLVRGISTPKPLAISKSIGVPAALPIRSREESWKCGDSKERK